MKKLVIVASLLGVLQATIAQSINLTPLAIKGYDPVAYFTNNEAVEGSAQYEVEHEGAIYRFKTEAHKQLFQKNPVSYLPQYGGFCATGVATANAKFPVDPTTFTVTEGKLYLFYNGPYQGAHFNGLDPWLEDEKGLIKKANQNWLALAQQETNQ
ncbi:MAG: YHS domain-containing (seleno)protein [Bacteroidota bacterium]